MKIGRYEVIGELGRGGMGSVSLARSPGGELVVLKRPLEDDPDLCERLRDEARVGLRLSHANVVETLDLFEHEGRPVLVVSYVSGASMHDLRLKGPLAIGAICRVGRQIADALDALHHATDERGHSLGMLHRDVTPGNIMLGHDGNARLIDLGIARSSENRAERTRTGFMRGTLRYLAPELFDNKDYSPASDLWSLGLVLLESALGRQMFRGTDAEIVGKIIAGKALDLSPEERLEPRFFKAIASLLKQKPDARPRRARDAAAVFAMLEKELGDSEALAAEAVLRAVGPPRRYDQAQGAAATRMLMHRAAATFCADVDRLQDEEATIAEDLSALRANVSSAETEQLVERTPPAGRGSPPQLERTGYFDPPPPSASFTGVPRTPSEALLEYAKQLRDFERPSKTSGSNPRLVQGAPLPAQPVQPADAPASAAPAALLPTLEPLVSRERTEQVERPRRAFVAPAAGPVPARVSAEADAEYEEWCLAPTVVEARPEDEPSKPMRVVRSHESVVALPQPPAPRRGGPLLVAAGFVAGTLAVVAALTWPELDARMRAGAPAAAPEAPAEAAAAPGEPATPAPPGASALEAAPNEDLEAGAEVPLDLALLEPASEVEAELRAEEDRSPAMPACFHAGRTRLFAYRDGRGTWVAARRFVQVPKRFRSSVRCVD